MLGHQLTLGHNIGLVTHSAGDLHTLLVGDSGALDIWDGAALLLGHTGALLSGLADPLLSAVLNIAGASIAIAPA